MHIPHPKPRNVARFVVDCTWCAAMTSVSTLAIEAVVDPQTESAEENCELAGFVIGSAIWYNTRSPVVNLVDRYADRRLARKAAKQARKTEVEETS